MKNNFGVKLELLDDGGVGVSDSLPFVTVARCVELVHDGLRIQNIDSRFTDFRINEIIVTFLVIIEKQSYRVKQKFNLGDVYPKLGQYVRGVMVLNQFGSYQFVMTHRLKVKE